MAHTRRQFLAELSALTVGSTLLGPGFAHAEPPPETKTIRLLVVVEPRCPCGR